MVLGLFHPVSDPILFMSHVIWSCSLDFGDSASLEHPVSVVHAISTVHVDYMVCDVNALIFLTQTTNSQVNVYERKKSTPETSQK